MKYHTLFRLLADDSHEISLLIFSLKIRNNAANLSSAAVVIATLRVKQDDFFSK